MDRSLIVRKKKKFILIYFRDGFDKTQARLRLNETKDNTITINHLKIYSLLFLHLIF